MDKFRYGVAVSSFFDNGLDDDSKLVPAAVFESAESKKRFAFYTKLRGELRRLFETESEVPADVERNLRRRINERRYKLLPEGKERPTFSLLTFGRMLRGRMRRRM